MQAKSVNPHTFSIFIQVEEKRDCISKPPCGVHNEFNNCEKPIAKQQGWFLPKIRTLLIITAEGQPLSSHLLLSYPATSGFLCTSWTSNGDLFLSRPAVVQRTRKASSTVKCCQGMTNWFSRDSQVVHTHTVLCNLKHCRWYVAYFKCSCSNGEQYVNVARVIVQYNNGHLINPA